jgi:hypothetical protein
LDEFTLDIAVWFSLVGLGKDRDENDKHAAWALVFNRLKELKTVDVVLSDGSILADAGEGVEERPVGVMNLKTFNDNLGI